MHEHHWNFERFFCENLVDSLQLPVSVVTRMLEDLAPETDLFETTTPAELTRGACFHKHVVIVEVTGPPKYLVFACSLLIVDVAHPLLAKRAVVKPVVADPTVNHWIHRH